MYRYFDKSQSGSISKADFFHLMNKDTHYEEQKVHLLSIEDVIKPLATSIKKYNADIDDVFARYDKDGNNMLSADELQNGLRHLSIFITNSDVKMLKDITKQNAMLRRKLDDALCKIEQYETDTK